MAPNGRRSAAERDLRLQRLDHFTIPVRDLTVASKFYREMLGGIVTQETDTTPDHVARPLAAHIRVQLFPAEGHLVTYLQPWGQPTPDQVFPHRAFTVAEAAQLDALRARLTAAGVPCVLATPAAAHEGAPVRASLYFRDPDSNQLELTCEGYPFRSDIRVGPFDPSIQYYPWAAWADAAPAGGSGR